VGHGTALAARFAKADPSELVAFKRHSVRRGETLAAVARKYNIPRTELAVANGLGTRARLRTGQTLIIPRAPSVALASSSSSTAARADVQRAARNTAPKTVTYRVKKGDTLSQIAARHDVSVTELKRWNKLSSNNLRIGARLTIHR
jgi:membrane-bound lytic murein transglycosylase D